MIDKQHEENKTVDVEFPSGQLAIVDASVIENLDHPLVENAIMLPTKSKETVFRVIGEYDDAILRDVHITPKTYLEPEQEAEPAGHLDHKEDETQTEASIRAPTLSHDSSVERKIRKHRTRRSKHHMKGHKKHKKTPELRGIVKRRGRNNKPELDESMMFIITHHGEDCTPECLNEVSDLASLRTIALTMMEMMMKGWKQEGQYFVGPSGTRVHQKGWTINEDKLYTPNGPVDLDDDWLYWVALTTDHKIANSAQDYQAVIDQVSNVADR